MRAVSTMRAEIVRALFPHDQVHRPRMLTYIYPRYRYKQQTQRVAVHRASRTLSFLARYLAFIETRADNFNTVVEIVQPRSCGV